MTQELRDLKNSILEGRYADALEIVEELEAMSRKDYIIKIESFLVRFLVHLIKNQIEGRLTNSWAASISDSVVRIKKYNVKDNKNSHYIKQEEWEPFLMNNWREAIKVASIEVGGGVYKPAQLLGMVDQIEVFNAAKRFIDLTYSVSDEDLGEIIDQELSQLAGGQDWAF
ncbi:MAG TPA: DUF29 family protein [Halomicronema sp.]